MQVYGGVQVWLHAFLTSPIGGSERSTVFAKFIECIISSLGLTAVLDVMAKKKTRYCRESNPVHSTRDQLYFLLCPESLQVGGRSMSVVEPENEETSERLDTALTE
jgi:hypothetical protein